MSEILIISNEEIKGKRISEKIKLLRECDTVKTVSYIESISVLNSMQPSMIIVYCSNADSIGIVKAIRSIKSLDKVPVIFVMDFLIEDLLISAFDTGIDDFFFLTDTDSVILMRIFLSLQKAILYKQISFNNDILVSINIKDKQTGIYKKEQSSILLKNFFNKSIEENMENTIFMYLKPIAINAARLNMPQIANIISSIPRSNDIIAYGRDSGFYIILYKTDIAGAKSVALRIKKSINNLCKMFVAAAEISASFEEMEPVLYKSIQNQISTGKEFTFLYDLSFKEAAESVEIVDESGKNFKDFKKEFFDNFEKIVAPVFYQVQASNSDIYSKAEINFNINETESIFSIKQNNIASELIITYPTYMKVIIDIKHCEQNKQPEIRRLTYDFEDFSGEKLTSVLNDLIKEFSERINLNVLYENK